MRPTPVPTPSVAQPMPARDVQKVRKPEQDTLRSPRNETGRRPEADTTDYDDFSWM